MLVIIILSLLVLIHELGHFIAARKMGVHVEEFGIGYPPRALKLFRWKETLFSLNWLPFGGFVRLAGDDAETFERMADGKESAGVKQDSHLFSSRSQLQRIIIVLAGAAVNIVFAIIVFSASYAKIGIPTELPHPKIDIVAPNSPAEKAGVQVGDVVLSVNGEEVKNTEVLIGKIQQHRGETVAIQLQRGETQLEIHSYLRTIGETPSGEGSFGVELNDVELTHYPIWQMPFRGTYQGLKDSWAFAKMIPRVFGQVLVDLFTHGRISDDVSGPIGIVHMAQQEELASQGWMTILTFAAIISLNLGIMNVMPIPALDGGRAVFILLESVLGKRRRAKIEAYANNIGMVALLGLIVLISLKDVWKIFVK